MKRWAASFQVAATYISAIIGAGFASGQELVQFFVVFGRAGYLGIVFAGLVLSLIGYLVSFLVVNFRSRGYQALLKEILGARIGLLFDFWVTLSVFFGLSIMLAGCAAILNEAYGLNYSLGLIITGLCVGCCLLSKEKGLLAINSLLMPAVIVVALLVCLFSLAEIKPVEVFSAKNNPLIGGFWLKASLLYVFYNVIIALMILSSLEHSKLKAGSPGLLLGGAVLAVVGFLMVAALMTYRDVLMDAEVPMLFVANSTGVFLGAAYMMAILMAMLTSAVINAYGLVVRLSARTALSWGFLICCVIISAFPVALMGFTNLIGKFYPLSGYVGGVLVGAMILKLFKILL